MNKKQTWGRQPTYRNGKHNKRALKAFSDMASGMAIIVNDRKAAERLVAIKQKIDYQLDSANGADISLYVNSVFNDFISLRDVAGDGTKDELNDAVSVLEADITVMLGLIRAKVEVTPWDEQQDKRVVRFEQKVSSVKSIYKRTSDDYKKVHTQYEQAGMALYAPNEPMIKQRLESKVKRLGAYCESRQTALSVLGRILDELTELESYAKNSPALAGRIGRLINITALADFYSRPVKSQAQREKLEGELLFIMQNVGLAFKQGNNMDEVMYGKQKSADTTVQTGDTITVQTDWSENGISGTNKKQFGGQVQ